MRPQFWMFAGPNGAGKSTLVARRNRGRLAIVNPDEIALTLPDGRNRELEAGKLALQARSEHLTARRDFGVETTLTGRGELRLLKDAAQAGYRLNLVFVGLRDVDLSISRVGHRVLRGGHDVPEEALLRRFERSFANLAEALPLVYRAFLVDNTDRRHRLLAVCEDGRVRRRADLPPWAEAALAKAGL